MLVREIKLGIDLQGAIGSELRMRRVHLSGLFNLASLLVLFAGTCPQNKESGPWVHRIPGVRIIVSDKTYFRIMGALTTYMIYILGNRHQCPNELLVCRGNRPGCNSASFSISPFGLEQEEKSHNQGRAATVRSENLLTHKAQGRRV